MATTKPEKMNVYELKKAIDNSEGDSDYLHDLFSCAWTKEFPNLPFIGSLETDFNEVLGNFSEVVLTWGEFECTSYNREIPKFRYASSLKLSFGGKIDITSRMLLTMLNEADCLPDFGYHNSFVGFCVKSDNVINISCNS